MDIQQARKIVHDLFDDLRIRLLIIENINILEALAYCRMHKFLSDQFAKALQV